MYNTRRLLAGDEFEPSKPIHGTLLIAAKKARVMRVPGKIAAPPKAFKAKIEEPVLAVEIAPLAQFEEPVVEDIASAKADIASEADIAVADDIAAIRAEYQEKFGKRPYMGWDAATLSAKIAEPTPPAVVSDGW